MARTIRDSKLETRAARLRLAPQDRRPYFKTLVPGQLHLGYRRKRADLPGTWLVRRYIGAERYRVKPLGVADDFQDVGDGADVINFAEAQRLALAYKPPAEGARSGLTVTQALTDYILWLKAHRATGSDAEQRANRHIIPSLGKVRVADLTTGQLNKWRDALADSPALRRTKKGEKQNHGPAPSTPEARRARRATANRTITILKAALNRAFNEGHVSDDTAWRRFSSFENVNAARPGYLTVAEAQRLINAAGRDSGFRDLLIGALQTGARYGELCALRVRDFHRGKVAVHHSKSGKPRHIVLTDEGVRFFERLTAGRAADALMFTRPGGAQWNKGDQTRPMRQACERARIKPVVGFHQLRHTWASLSVMNATPLLVVAKNLGHVDTRMVERHYGHLEDSFIDKAIRAGAPKFGVVERGNVRRIR